MTTFYPTPPTIRNNGTIITPGATVFSPPLTKLYIGGTGSIVATMAQSGTITLTALPAGSWVNDVAITQVTTATATGLVGFF